MYKQAHTRVTCAKDRRRVSGSLYVGTCLLRRFGARKVRFEPRARLDEQCARRTVPASIRESAYEDHY